MLFQLKRLKECEKMLVALELAGWLNESNLALQGVVQCYGLVAPLIFYKIPSIPVFQVRIAEKVIAEFLCLAPDGMKYSKGENYDIYTSSQAFKIFVLSRVHCSALLVLMMRQTANLTLLR